MLWQLCVLTENVSVTARGMIGWNLGSYRIWIMVCVLQAASAVELVDATLLVFYNKGTQIMSWSLFNGRHGGVLEAILVLIGHNSCILSSRREFGTYEISHRKLFSISPNYPPKLPPLLRPSLLLRLCRNLQFCQHRALFDSSLLTCASPVLKALAQATMLVRKVLFTPADPALVLTSALLVDDGIAAFSPFLQAPAFLNAAIFISSIEAFTLELVAGSPVFFLAAIHRGGAIRCR